MPHILRYQNKLNTNFTNFDTQDYFKVKNIVKNLEIPFIDVHEELFSKNENMLDYLPFNDTRFHFTSEGYKIIAELIFELTSQK